MKHKKIILLTLLLLFVFTCNVFASSPRPMNAIFMGEVEEVQKNEEENIISIKTKGYIKGCQSYKEEIVAILTDETIIIPDKMPAEGEEPKIEKVNIKDFNVKKGDIVFLVLSEAMTKSIPPQVVVKAIQLTQNN